MNQDVNRRANRITAARLSLVAVFMFGFGYAMVPLYDVFCEITGLNGKTGEISDTDADTLKIDADRLVTVEFDSNVNSELPWEFRPGKRKIQVHPGEVTEVLFYARNLTGRTNAGQAVPSVAPAKGSVYFSKTECFCFSRQVLGPGERKQMPVRFVIDPRLPESIGVLTLSYTFFPAPGAAVPVTTGTASGPVPESS